MIETSPSMLHRQIADLTHVVEEALSKACKRLTAILPLLAREPVPKERLAG
jgi:hypothetical protein